MLVFCRCGGLGDVCERQVVHNAGVAVGGAFEDLPEAQLRRVMETNFFGVIELTRALLPTFRAQRAGRIGIVSSESASAGQSAHSIYCPSLLHICPCPPSTLGRSLLSPPLLTKRST